MKNTLHVEKILSPRTIAIVGATNKKGKVGNMLVNNTSSFGYAGTVYYVNQKGGTIKNHHVYESLADLPEEVDLAIIAIPSAFVRDVIDEGSHICKNYIVISAGFGEAGIAGHNREMALLSLAEKKNLTILGPNCLGVLTPRLGLNASFAPGLPSDGTTAFISQSGALAVALVDKAADLGIGFSSVVSVGNKMQLSETQLLEYFVADTHTKVIAFYLEGIQDGAAFLCAAHDAHKKGKRVILLKSGRTKEARKAIALHTGSLAGSDDVLAAACKKVGIIRVDTIEDLFDTIRGAAYFTAKEITDPVRTVVITNAGGPGVLSTDFIAQSRHITLGSLSSTGKTKLSAKLPSAASVHNPLDLLGDASTQRYADALKACATQKNIDAILILLTPQDQTPVADIARAIVTTAKSTKKIILTSFIGGASVREGVEILKKAGVAHFETPGQAIHVLDTLVGAEKSTLTAEPACNEERTQRAARILSHDKIGSGSLYLHDVTKIAKLYDIPIAPFWDVANPRMRSRVSYPCVVKVDDPHILHKSDRGGVILPINNAKELTSAISLMKKRFPEETVQVIAQPLLPIKMELIIGMTRDPIFGPLIVVGLGGIYTEVFKRREFVVGAFSRREVRRILKNGTLGFLFTSTRGQDPYDLDTVVTVIEGLSAIAREHVTVQAIDINPLLLYNNKQQSVAVDMKIVM